jgi:hypothetical protein
MKEMRIPNREYEANEMIGGNGPVTCPSLKIGDCLLMADLDEYSVTIVTYFRSV